MEVLEEDTVKKKKSYFYQELFNRFDDLNLFSEPSENFIQIIG
jgi:hypothetical protein